MENKTSKYFKYAIGEIILVVIGILIALKVSNWNEQRKVASKTESLLDKFEEELRLTIFNANFDVSNSIVGDSLIKRVLKNKVSRQDYLENERLKHLLTWRFTLNPETDNMDKIIEKEEVLHKKYKGILYDINRFSFIRDREIDAMNVLKISAEENSDFINLNHAWARQSDSLSCKRALNYYLNDEAYKNRLFSHWKKTMNYNDIITMYRVDILRILSKLKIVREGYSAPDFKKLYNELEQKPFIEIGLDESIENLVTDDELVKSSIIINFTKDTLQIKSKNRKGDVFRFIPLNPGEVTSSRPYLNDLNNDYLKIFEVYKDDICVKKYQEVQYGYLILE